MFYRFVLTIKTGVVKFRPHSGIQLSRNMFDANIWSSMGRNCTYFYNQIQCALTRWYGTSSNRKYTVAIEGNIGSGKTLLLEYFKPSPVTEVYMEPVQKWRNVQGQNALAKMYEDPKRWSLTFQTYVQLTMLETHIEKQTKPIKLMERSIYSAKHCFVENLYNNGTMPEIEYIVLSRWFNFITKHEDCAVDLIVYLQAKPEVLYERIKRRGRKEEKPIELLLVGWSSVKINFLGTLFQGDIIILNREDIQAYLEQLHELHEDWLIHQTDPTHLPLTQDNKPAPVIVLDANQDLTGMLEQYESNRDLILCGCSS